MSKRITVVTIAVLAAIGLAIKFRPSRARAAGNVTVLQPVRSFRVQGLEGSRLSDVAVYGDNLFLLVKNADGANEILEITSSGGVLRRILLPVLPNLPKTQTFRQLRISQSGTLAVFIRHPSDRTTVFLYDTEGTLKTSFDLPATLFEMAFLGNDLVTVGPNGIERLVSETQGAPNLPLSLVDPPTALMNAPMPQSRLAVVEVVSGRLQIASTSAALVGPTVLYAPEIQGVQRPQVENGWTAVISSVASSPNGHLYFGITGHKRQDGAPVLEFDGAGTLKGRFKCILPTFGLDPADHQSFMYPGKLVATNDSLFWISMSEKKIAMYSTSTLP